MSSDFVESMVARLGGADGDDGGIDVRVRGV
jgi:hypothetical protein